jgi:hypothetical protein
MLPQAAPTGGINHVLLAIGTDVPNRVVVFNPGATSVLQVGRTIGGVYASAPDVSFTPGVPTTVNLSFNGSQTGISIGGGATVTLAGLPTLASLFAGSDINGATPAFGYIQSLGILPGVALPDAELPGLIM